MHLKGEILSISQRAIHIFEAHYEELNEEEKSMGLSFYDFQSVASSEYPDEEPFLSAEQLFDEYENRMRMLKRFQAEADLDLPLKQVNDRLGHIVGDQVRQETGRLLKKITRKTDLCGRLGGDEFVVFVQNVTNVGGISKCAEKINQALSLQYGDADHLVTVTASIGVAVVRDELCFKDLYERADKMLYQVKKETKNGYKIDG